MSVGPIRRCQGSQRPAAVVNFQCSACKRVACLHCGRYVALYPNGTYVVHLPRG